MADLEQMLQFLEATFRVSEYKDYPNALNGLQVQGPADVHRLAVAVDASEVTIRAAVEREAQLLIVHHGLFWDGLGDALSDLHGPVQDCPFLHLHPPG